MKTVEYSNRTRAHTIKVIEITPRMIEAGEEALNLYDPDFDHAKDVAIRVYIAMEEARRSSS